MKVYSYGMTQKDKTVLLCKEHTYKYEGEDKFSSSEAVAKLLKSTVKLHEKAEEYVYLLCFSSSMSLIGLFEVSHGWVDCTSIRPREILCRALLCGAASIIISHNHPSGNLNVSKEDIDVTKRIVEACRIIGIPLMDHIIVSEQGYCSLKEKGII